MNSNNSDDNHDEQTAEELLAEGGGTRRTATDAPEASDEGVDDLGLQAAIKNRLEAIAADEMNIHLQFYDESLAALLGGVEDAGQLERLIEAAADELGRNPPGNNSRAKALALLVRVGLENVDDSLIAEATEAKKEYAMEQATEF